MDGNQKTITTRDQLQRKQVLRAFFIYLGAIAAVEFGIMLFLEELGFILARHGDIRHGSAGHHFISSFLFFDYQASACTVATGIASKRRSVSSAYTVSC